MTSNTVRYNDRMLKAGDKAPTFKLAAAGGKLGKPISLNDFAGSYVVLYFYPKDDTPGCTRQAQAFTEMGRAFAGLGATVLGVSRDSVARHETFQKKYDLGVTLLSDPDLTVHKLYGTFGTKMMYGRATEGTIRTTFVIGPTGRIVSVFPKVRVDGHAEKVLDALREAQGLEGGSDDEAPAMAPAKAAKPAKKTVKQAPAPAAKPAKKAAKKAAPSKAVAPKKVVAKKPAARSRKA